MEVFGVNTDPQTRCAHWGSHLDVVAIKFKCCNKFYACRECHDELEPHHALLWKREERFQHAVLCGVCQKTMSIADYLECEDFCPHCRTPFNPGCRSHRALYFDF
ncbi:MAG TPA: CHY zinc finger protein [Fimbriimonadaceae bacterium]|nr:CHY zinc finger protein [Fimbriimonadaceae bacterium]